MADKKKQKTGPMRLDKFLGEMGYGTRTQIKEMVRKGRVQVNGQVIKAPESKLAPETDQVMVDQAWWDMPGWNITCLISPRVW